MKKSLLLFHPALAPYRVDFFNALHRAFNAHFYFNHHNVVDQNFDQSHLQTLCEFEPQYLDKGFELAGKSIRFGAIDAIKKHKPDIILCSEYSPLTLFIFTYIKLLGKKIKLYTLSDDSLENARERKGFRAYFRNKIAKESAGVIFASKEVIDWHKNNVPSISKTLELPIIHNDSVMRNRYVESINEANENIKKYGLEGKKVILFVGRLVEVKNLPFLFNSFSKIDDNNCILILVGEGELKFQLETLTKDLKISEKVIFTGRKEGKELYNWYVLSQIFVFPSTYERYGAVVNEALLAGCFTLCSTAAGASSLINENNGMLFNPKEENDLVKKMNMAIKKCEPLPLEIIEIRENKMPFSFDEKIGHLIDQL